MVGSVNSTTRTLSESASKAMLRGAGVPMAPEFEVETAEQAAAAAVELGFPVAVKLCGDRIAHKTERGLVKLRLADGDSVMRAASDLLGAATVDDGPVSLLVATMISGSRELIAGVVRDPQFGPTIMLGIGGILAEAIADVVFRPAPISDIDAFEMIDELRTQLLLHDFRGERAVDRTMLMSILVGLSDVLDKHPEVVSIDLNPIIVQANGSLVAVDALVEVGTFDGPGASVSRPAPTPAQFQALFNPRGVLIAGASSHPGKFGFVSLHNLLASGYNGQVFATNLEAEVVLGVQTVASIDELPHGEIDLVVLCTPASANQTILRSCAAIGITAAFVTSAGYGEAGPDGQQAEHSLVQLADDLGMLLAGPNGQGLVSTPANLCAQIVAPYPPAGSIAIASQSGNFVSSFLNYSRQTGVGISRAVSAGNAAAVSPADYLRWYSNDPSTSVSLAYVEGIIDGRALLECFTDVSTRKPLVVVKGGSTVGGARAAASHTGALASNDKIFNGVCRQSGVCRAASVEEAFEAAATFATQPLPQGPNVVVLTTAGGWGVVTSDAIFADGRLQLFTLPADLLALIDTKLPPRWSRSNPVDCAGGETRETIPEVMEMIAAHPLVHSMIYLGIGIQSNQARLMREGGFYPNFGLDRIVAYHERQDARFAEAAAELSVRYNKPILTATELAIADPSNAGPAAVRASGRLCYASGNRAVTALGHLWQYAQFRQQHQPLRQDHP